MNLLKVDFSNTFLFVELNEIKLKLAERIDSLSMQLFLNDFWKFKLMPAIEYFVLMLLHLTWNLTLKNGSISKKIKDRNLHFDLKVIESNSNHSKIGNVQSNPKSQAKKV